MQLDSVRVLKAELAATLLQNLAGAVQQRTAFGVSAQRLNATLEMPRTLALGVAPRGRNDYRLAIRVQHRLMQHSPELTAISEQAKGEVDIRYIGRVAKRVTPWHQQQNRPLLIGGSIGHFKVTAGTLGCFVQPRGSGALHLLSNNHVLANENNAKAGDAILQPGQFDGGSNPADVVGQLADFIKLKKRGINLLDCATASVSVDIKVHKNKLTGLGKLTGVGDAFLDEGTSVAKVGRTTGLTRGRVTAFELDNIVVAYDLGSLRFDGQLEIEGEAEGPFSEGGDSGSLIVGEDLRALALLFAGSDQGGTNGQGLTYANPISTVLAALNMELVF